MTLFKNEHSVSLMVWETKAHKRNTNNVIKFCSTHEVKAEDKIIGHFGETGVSEYTIVEILESRPAKLKGHTYFTASTTWKNQPPMIYKGLDLSLMGKFFPKFIDEYKEPTPEDKKPVRFK